MVGALVPRGFAASDATAATTGAVPSGVVASRDRAVDAAASAEDDFGPRIRRASHWLTVWGAQASLTGFHEYRGMQSKQVATITAIPLEPSRTDTPGWSRALPEAAQTGYWWTYREHNSRMEIELPKSCGYRFDSSMDHTVENSADSPMFGALYGRVGAVSASNSGGQGTCPPPPRCDDEDELTGGPGSVAMPAAASSVTRRSFRTTSSPTDQPATGAGPGCTSGGTGGGAGGGFTITTCYYADVYDANNNYMYTEFYGCSTQAVS